MITIEGIISYSKLRGINFKTAKLGFTRVTIFTGAENPTKDVKFICGPDSEGNSVVLNELDGTFELVQSKFLFETPAAWVLSEKGGSAFNPVYVGDTVYHKNEVRFVPYVIAPGSENGRLVFEGYTGIECHQSEMLCNPPVADGFIVVSKADVMSERQARENFSKLDNPEDYAVVFVKFANKED